MNIKRQVKKNLIPILLTVAVTTGLFFILSYISYDIHSYKPTPITVNDMIKGRIEPDNYISDVEIETLDEFYKEPKPSNEQPEINIELFNNDDTQLYKWLGLTDTTHK